MKPKRAPRKCFRTEKLEERIAPKKGTVGASGTIGGDFKNGWTNSPNNPHDQQY